MKLDAISKELLDEVKDKLDITWDDNDASVKSIIFRACTYLQSKVSQKLQFTQDSEEYSLLLERCRYDWNNALDEFETNYASEILSFIQSYALKDWRDKNGKSTNS
ncbi:phage head-tail connector protein [Candidatus Enterococcus murrayae]|uniref:Phage head-tail connector protein n=1 Tax=Candidatus Enterococcus murrayae TaxID=2815321 RepID=A0ABS3HC40_9ENTE|nr:phage head-tail connector protein [Enterococcus sp. MJM16]MBO0450758.1 phage head-tail connector protein [Enterococcus sp. MJM16]